MEFAKSAIYFVYGLKYLHKLTKIHNFLFAGKYLL